MANLPLSVDRFISVSNGIWEQIRGAKRATITQAGIDASGRNDWVTATVGVGAKALRGVKIYVGDNANIMVGDVYYVYGKDNPAKPDFRLGERIKSKNPPHGANYAAPILALTIPAGTDPGDPLVNPIGVGTESDLVSATGNNGEHAAIARVFYRTIVPGSYAVYDQHITQTQVQYKRQSESTWRLAPTQSVSPSEPKTATLNGAITIGALSAALTDPNGDLAHNFPVIGFYVYWQIDGEVLIGKLAADGTLTILQRAAEGSTAAAHRSGALVTLLSGVAVVSNLEPGVTHDIRIAAITGYGLQGPYSSTVSFTSWMPSNPPIVPGLTVTAQQGIFQLVWTRPTSGGQPITKALYYKVYRNVSATTVGAQTSIERSPGLTENIPVFDWPTPGTVYQAGYFGIQTIDRFGQLSITGGTNGDGIRWASDVTAPATPDQTTVAVIPTIGSVHVSVGDLVPLQDAGFKCFRVFRAANQSATGQTIGASGILDYVDFAVRATAIDYQIVDYGVPYVYQVTSVDWAGNAGNCVSGAAWKYCPSIAPSTGIMVNGNFQIPNDDASLPKFWTVATSSLDFGVITTSPSYLSISYQANGGVLGNYRMKLSYDGTSLDPYTTLIFELYSTVKVPINQLRLYRMSLFAQCSTAAVTIVGFQPTYRLYDGQTASATYMGGAAGKGAQFSPSSYAGFDPFHMKTFVPNTWQEADGLDMQQLRYGDGTVYALFGVQIQATPNVAFDLYLDDIVIELPNTIAAIVGSP